LHNGGGRSQGVRRCWLLLSLITALPPACPARGWIQVTFKNCVWSQMLTGVSPDPSHPDPSTPRFQRTRPSQSVYLSKDFMSQILLLETWLVCNKVQMPVFFLISTPKL
jgi:hypothetical protein